MRDVRVRLWSRRLGRLFAVLVGALHHVELAADHLVVGRALLNAVLLADILKVDESVLTSLVIKVRRLVLISAITQLVSVAFVGAEELLRLELIAVVDWDPRG